MGANIRERPKGSGVWWLFINHNGRRTAKKIGRDEDLALEVAKKVEAKLVLGDFGFKQRGQVVTLKDYAALWLALPHDWKRSTRETYQQNLNLHILPKLGSYPLDTITRKDLKNHFNRLLTKGLSPASVKQIKGTISSLMSEALDSELIESNFVIGIKIKGSVAKELEVDPLTEPEANLLLEQAKAYQGGVWYPVLLCALRTGMRIGELEALKWGDIDFTGRFIAVRRSARKRHVSSTKSGKRRRVDMSPLLAETLKALRVTQKKRALKQGRAMSEWVFANNAGNMMHRERFTIVLNKCLEKAGLRRIRVHDLRHSYATIRLMRGHNLKDVSYQLGHSSVMITDGTYCHWIPGKFKNEVDELDRPQLDATYTQPGKSGQEMSSDSNMLRAKLV